MLKNLPKTQELLEVAKHVVWFKEPEDTLAHKEHFLAYLMTYGTVEDVNIVKKYLKDEDFVYALEHAPPGVFDVRSWHYWNLIYHRLPVPKMPERKFD